jgi:hypothetical protein
MAVTGNYRDHAISLAATKENIALAWNLEPKNKETSFPPNAIFDCRSVYVRLNPDDEDPESIPYFTPLASACGPTIVPGFDPNLFYLAYTDMNLQLGFVPLYFYDD